MPQKKNEWYEFYLGWMIRELYRVRLLSAGRLLFHASAVEIQGQTVFLCGSKGSGKTSILLEMLDRGCGFVANDKAVVNTDSIPAVVSGFPVFVGIGVGTLTRFPQFDDWLRDFSELTIPQYKLNRRPDEIANSFNTEKKLLLLVGELLRKFSDNRLVTSSPLRAIINVSFDAQCNEAILQRVETDEAKRRILEENICLSDDEVFKDIFSLIAQNASGFEGYVRWLMENVEIYSLTQNYDCRGSYEKIRCLTTV